MKKLLLLLSIILPAIVSCSDESESERILSIGEADVLIPVKGETNIEISGVEPSECKVSSENEFVAYPLILNGMLNITSYHIGETKIVVEYKNQKKECNVIVEPLSKNILGNPVLDFGSTKVEIKSNIKGQIIKESNNSIEVKEQDGNTYYHEYHFSDNKLECVMTNTYAKEDFSDITGCLNERYKLITASDNYYWYEYPGKLISRMWIKEWNGGYQIEYSTDKRTLSKYYQVD